MDIIYSYDILIIGILTNFLNFIYRCFKKDKNVINEKKYKNILSID